MNLQHEQFILSIPHEFTPSWSGPRQVEAVIDFDHINGAVNPDSIWIAFKPIEGFHVRDMVGVASLVSPAIDNYMASREETILDSLNKVVDRKETNNY